MSTMNVTNPPKARAQVAGQNPSSEPKNDTSNPSNAAATAAGSPAKHVCTEACTHEGATKGGSASAMGTVTPASSKAGDATTQQKRS